MGPALEPLASTAHDARAEHSQFIPKGRDEVFSFFADASNLERITPAFLHFRILTPRPISMKPAALIDYELRLYGVPMNWRTRIEIFEPPRSFTDIQLSGPYRRWQHRHEFVEVAGGTEMTDVVEYELPLGLLGVIARSLFVLRALNRIFDYRRAAIAEIFAGRNPTDPQGVTNSKTKEPIKNKLTCGFSELHPG